MNKLEFKNILDKWNPTIEEFIKNDNINNDEIDQDTLSKVEKICLYAHYHSIHEREIILNNFPINNENSKSLLAFSLKVLNRLSNLDNIYLINSPRYDINDKTYAVGSVMLSFDITKDEEYIINKLVEHLEELKITKKIYVYIIAQSLTELKDDNSNSKITVTSRYFTI